ncbi:glycosyltransferase, partial [Salmonella enterica]|nr:glycosyltransferase [Salmonella enterica]
EKVLDGVLTQTFPASKIIIIDNNSSDDTQIIIKQKKSEFKQIEYYNTGENLGGAGGFNYGFRIAEKHYYDFIWIMDDDLLPEKTCLEHLILSADHDGIYQPLRFNLDGSCAELSPVVYDLSNPFYMNPKRLTVLNYYNNRHKDVHSAFKIHGVPFEGPLISKKVIDCIGFPNPDFFIFYDDLDFSLRARKKGYTIECVPIARATRLLYNNQANDLDSWKGYFMLRNLFYIHYTYGENFFVRIKPYFIAAGYFMLSLLKLNFKQCKTIFLALMDSYDLRNSNLHKPQ